MENKAASGVLGVILAGGLSRRMGGGDKGMLRLGGQPVISHVAARLATQVDALVLNANGDAARWASLGLPVIPDGVAGYPGPLAGLLAAMEWAAAPSRGFGWVAAVPCDSPFLPYDLVARLTAALGDGVAAIAISGERRHPVTGLFSVDLRGDLADFLAAGERRAGAWAARIGAREARFGGPGVDPFFNINTPEELAEAARLGVD